MQNSTGNGIICDMCKIIYTEDFKYYSFDIRKTTVNNNIMAALEYLKKPDESIDVCEGCNTKVKNMILKYHKATLCIPIRNYPNGIICEFSGKRLQGTYQFYHIVVSEVIVKMSNMPYICIGCKAQITDVTKPCSKCGKDQFHKKADVNTYNRAYEAWISQDAYDTIHKSVKRSKEASQWSSSGA